MSYAYQEILQKSKELSLEEKEKFALFLLHNLETGERRNYERTEKQWQAEIRRRDNEFETGVETGVAWEDIKQRYSKP